MRALVLVGKADCPLCEEAREVVEKVAADLGLEVERVEVGSEPGLEGYRDRVPVVLWNGQVIGQLRIREGALRERLLRR